MENLVEPKQHKPDKTWILFLALILVIAAAMRFVSLNSVPPGLWFDEALDARDATLAAYPKSPADGFHIVYTDVFPREPMYITILACVIRLFGNDVTTLRATSAFVGVLTIVALYFCLYSFFGSSRVPLIAAMALATMRWHVIFSRLLFRTLLLPLWIILIVWSANEARRKGGMLRFALFGGLIGGGFYTYLSWYFMLPGVLPLAAWVLWEQKKTSSRWVSEWAFCLLSCALVSAPILIDYGMHPDHLLARPAAVSPLEQENPGREIAENFFQALGMFHWKGDHVSKQNIPHAPGLNPIEGLLMVIGLLVAVGARKHREDATEINSLSDDRKSHHADRPLLSFIVCGWLILGILPTIFTQTDSPNFLRTLVVTPAVATLIALGLDGLWRFGERRLRGEWTRPVCAGLALALLFVSAQWTVRQVFFEWSRLPEVWHGFNGEFAQLGAAAREHSNPATQDGKDADEKAKKTFWLPAYLGEHLTVRFLAGEYNPQPNVSIRRYSNLDFLRPRNDAQGERLVVATAHNKMYPILERLVPNGEVVEEYRAPEGNVWALLYRIPTGALPDPKDVNEAESAITDDIAW